MKARIVVTWRCTRDCALCCNKFPSVREQVVPLNDLAVVMDAEEICVTGGEPLLVPDRTEALLRELRGRGFSRKIWLYSSIWRTELERVMPLIDGIQYTIHAGASQRDIDSFRAVQDLLANWPRKHNRLKIDCTEPIGFRIDTTAQAWCEVRLRPFLSNETLVSLAPNGGVPTGEVLYELGGIAAEVHR